MPRPDRPSHPKAGEGDLRKARKIDRPGGPVQMFHGGQSPPAIAQIAVQVVLHDDRAGFSCHLQYHLPCGLGHRGSRRVLKVGRKHDHPRTLFFHGSGELIHFVLTQRHAGHAGATAREYIAQPWIYGIFQQDRFPARREHALQQIESLLAAAGDQNVVVRARDAPLPRLVQQISAERSVPRRWPKLKNLGCLRRIEHLRQVARNSSSGKSISDGRDAEKLIRAATGSAATPSRVSSRSGRAWTKLPRPTWPRISPSDSSSSYAAATVVRFRPSEPANSRVGGSFSPRASPPCRIAVLNCS